MPDSKREKSVYRTDDLTAEQILAIGREFVESADRSIKAAAHVSAGVIFGVGLTVESATEPHPRHANIRGYSGDRPADRILAKKIADGAALVAYPV
jgi:hypothetical protein